MRALHDHLSGVTSLERAIALGRQETRRYAKRQTTWFRTQMPGTARMPDRYRAESKRESLALVERLLLTGGG